MITELLAFALIVGQVEIAPGVIQTEYLQNSTEIITVIEKTKWLTKNYSISYSNWTKIN